jgi:glutathione S-transferase
VPIGEYFMPTNLSLITIPISHYAEKARWALDYLEIPYRERSHMPPFHRNATKKYGGTSVPVLVTADRSICDSTEILHYLDTLQPGKLYPIEPEIQALSIELETLFNGTLGVHSRRWGYSYVLTPELIYPKWTQGIPLWEKLLFPIVFPKVKPIILQMMDITASSGVESYREIVGVFDRVDRILADGRKYLLGDRFSAIDLTFAALAAPLLQPLEHHIPPTPIELLPMQAQTDIRNCQATSAGRLGLRLYREHRR